VGGEAETQVSPPSDGPGEGGEHSSASVKKSDQRYTARAYPGQSEYEDLSEDSEEARLPRLSHKNHYGRVASELAKLKQREKPSPTLSHKQKPCPR